MTSILLSEKINSIVKYAAHAPAGIFAECGVYKGGLVKLLAQSFPDRIILGFDTFEGLPVEHWNENERHKPQDFNDTSLESVQEFIKPYNNIKLIKGLFPYTAKPYENERFAFVHVDFDFYEGTKACLNWFWPRLLVNGIMLFDDYEWKHCPGVKQALDEFRFAKVFKTVKHQAAIIKTCPITYL